MGLTKLAFTICSNNYLAQAKTAADSLIQYNPEYKFVIGLVDELSNEIDYDFFHPHEIIPITEIGLQEFESLSEKYNIIELNTSVKASFFKYIFDRFKHIDHSYYFDPDFMFFNSLSLLDDEFKTSDILLTPHINTPIALDDSFPHENLFLNFGIYNLGFIGVKRSENSFRFLDWWEERTINHGFIDIRNGYFVDQLWINFVPLFFNKVKIIKEFGYNVGPWNLHERKQIEKREDGFYMKDESKLVFYHFSNYKFRNPENISTYYSRYTFDNCPDLIPLYEIYNGKLIENKIEKLSIISCIYYNDSVQTLKNKKESKMKRVLKLFIPPIFFKIRQ
jgi:hypothetical protein